MSRTTRLDSRTRRQRLLGVALLAMLGGCAGEPTSGESISRVAPSAPAMSRAYDQAAEHRDLAALRTATAHFHRIDLAKEAGWDTQFPAGCFSSDAGAMGLHYLNGTRVGTLAVTEPQLVMYEPQKNGTQKLVGVEYIVPGTPDDTPPVLFGQTFAYNPVFGVWVLHVWAWQHNPRGLYADWNPSVSCRFAAAVSSAAHH